MVSINIFVLCGHHHENSREGGFNSGHIAVCHETKIYIVLRASRMFTILKKKSCPKNFSKRKGLLSQMLARKKAQVPGPAVCTISSRAGRKRCTCPPSWS